MDKLIVVSLGDLFADSCSICGTRAYYGTASRHGPEGCREAVTSGRVFCEECLTNQVEAIRNTREEVEQFLKSNS
jgi:hypothetical protein